MSVTHIPKSLRERVAAEANQRCGYCLSSEAVLGMSFEIDQLFPPSCEQVGNLFYRTGRLYR